MTDWVSALLAGSRRALARAISQIENGSDAVLAALYPHAGRAHRVGITGAGGVGKSTLAGRLAHTFRAHGATVGILAVDPTSPFTGGALLGDRVRMDGLAGDPGIFIRSMASRGAPGGLARATADAAVALDAAGFDMVLIETVGAGQGDVDIARTAHTTLVVEAPGMGDAVQTLKAGLMEIADVLVVNKADRPGARATVQALRGMLELAPNDAWQPPIVETVATTGGGVEALYEAIAAHRTHLEQARAMQTSARAEAEVVRRLREGLLEAALRRLGEDTLAAAIEQVAAHRLDPQTAAERLIAALGLRDG